MNGQHRYEEIARAYRQMITRGVYRPGDPLPPVSDIAQGEHVALGTARQAMEMLDREGATTPGRPRRVALRKLADVHLPIPPGRGDPALEVEALPQLAGPEVARRLGVGDSDLVWLRRVAPQPGVQDSAEQTWFPLPVAEAVPELRSPVNIEAGSITLLEARWKIGLATEITTRPASPEEAARLGVSFGEWVLDVWVTGSRRDGTAVYTVRTVYPGSGTRLLDP